VWHLPLFAIRPSSGCKHISCAVSCIRFSYKVSYPKPTIAQKDHCRWSKSVPFICTWQRLSNLLRVTQPLALLIQIKSPHSKVGLLLSP
jgi:hypothetical protein